MQRLSDAPLGDWAMHGYAIVLDISWAILCNDVYLWLPAEHGHACDVNIQSWTGQKPRTHLNHWAFSNWANTLHWRHNAKEIDSFISLIVWQQNTAELVTYKKYLSLHGSILSVCLFSDPNHTAEKGALNNYGDQLDIVPLRGLCNNSFVKQECDAQLFMLPPLR